MASKRVRRDIEALSQASDLSLMPPKGWRKAPVTEAEARADRNGSICSFFSRVSAPPLDAALPVKKRGRPPKATTTRGQKAHPNGPEEITASPVGGESVEPAASASGMPTAAAQEEPAPKPKVPRTNWSKAANLARLTKALDDWRNKTGSLLSDMPEMSLHSFARCVGITKSLLHGYLHSDPTKRKSLGASVGRHSLITPQVQEFVVHVLRRRDRGNDGMSNSEAASMVVDLEPKLSTIQVG